METLFFSQLFFFFAMIKRAVPIGNNPKYVFAILQGDSNRIEFLAELNASKIMIQLPYQVPSSRCIGASSCGVDDCCNNYLKISLLTVKPIFQCQDF